MARRASLAWDDVRAVMAGFPGTLEGTSYGTPGFRAGKKFLARLREEGVLVLAPLEEIEKRFLPETHPDVHSETDHYRGGTAILIRLAAISKPNLRERVESRWQRLATKRMLAQREALSPTVPGVSR